MNAREVLFPTSSELDRRDARRLTVAEIDAEIAALARCKAAGDAYTMATAAERAAHYAAQVARESMRAAAADVKLAVEAELNAHDELRAALAAYEALMRSRGAR